MRPVEEKPSSGESRREPASLPQRVQIARPPELESTSPNPSVSRAEAQELPPGPGKRGLPMRSLSSSSSSSGSSSATLSPSSHSPRPKRIRKRQRSGTSSSQTSSSGPPIIIDLGSSSSDSVTTDDSDGAWFRSMKKSNPAKAKVENASEKATGTHGKYSLETQKLPTSSMNSTVLVPNPNIRNTNAQILPANSNSTAASLRSTASVSTSSVTPTTTRSTACVSASSVTPSTTRSTASVSTSSVMPTTTRSTASVSTSSVTPSTPRSTASVSTSSVTPTTTRSTAPEPASSVTSSTIKSSIITTTIQSPINSKPETAGNTHITTYSQTNVSSSTNHARPPQDMSDRRTLDLRFTPNIEPPLVLGQKPNVSVQSSRMSPLDCSACGSGIPTLKITEGQVHFIFDTDSGKVPAAVVPLSCTKTTNPVGVTSTPLLSGSKSEAAQIMIPANAAGLLRPTSLSVPASNSKPPPMARIIGTLPNPQAVVRPIPSRSLASAKTKKPKTTAAAQDHPYSSVFTPTNASSLWGPSIRILSAPRIPTKTTAVISGNILSASITTAPLPSASSQISTSSPLTSKVTAALTTNVHSTPLNTSQIPSPFTSEDYSTFDVNMESPPRSPAVSKSLISSVLTSTSKDYSQTFEAEMESPAPLSSKVSNPSTSISSVLSSEDGPTFEANMEWSPLSSSQVPNPTGSSTVTSEPGPISSGTSNPSSSSLENPTTSTSFTSTTACEDVKPPIFHRVLPMELTMPLPIITYTDEDRRNKKYVDLLLCTCKTSDHSETGLGGGDIFAHRIMLEQIPFVRKQLTPGSLEADVINLPGFNPAAVESIVRMYYARDLRLTENYSLEELFAVVEKFEIEGLINCWTLRAVAEDKQNQEFLDIIDSYIIKNFAKSIENQLIAQVPYTQMSRYVTDGIALQLPHGLLLNAIVTWATNDLENRRDLVYPLILPLDLGRIFDASPRMLRQVFAPGSVLAGIPACVQLHNQVLADKAYEMSISSGFKTSASEEDLKFKLEPKDDNKIKPETPPQWKPAFSGTMNPSTDSIQVKIERLSPSPSPIPTSSTQQLSYTAGDTPQPLTEPSPPVQAVTGTIQVPRTEYDTTALARHMPLPVIGHERTRSPSPQSGCESNASPRNSNGPPEGLPSARAMTLFPRTRNPAAQSLPKENASIWPLPISTSAPVFNHLPSSASTSQSRAAVFISLGIHSPPPTVSSTTKFSVTTPKSIRTPTAASTTLTKMGSSKAPTAQNRTYRSTTPSQDPLPPHLEVSANLPFTRRDTRRMSLSPSPPKLRSVVPISPSPVLVFPVVDGATRYLEVFDFKNNSVHRRLHVIKRHREFSCLLQVENMLYEIGGSSEGKHETIWDNMYSSNLVDLFYKGQLEPRQGFSLNKKRRCFSAVYSSTDGCLYVMGGDVNDKHNKHNVLVSNVMEKLEISERVYKWKTDASLLNPRSCHASAFLGDDLYTVGGIGASNSDADGDAAMNIVEVLDAHRTQWTLAAPMRTGRRCLRLFVMDRKMYAIGGEDTMGNLLNSVEVYDPEVGTWEFVASMNHGRSDFGIFQMDGQIYVVGGNSDKPNDLTIETYDPSTNTWTIIPWPKELNRHALFRSSTTISRDYLNP